MTTSKRVARSLVVIVAMAFAATACGSDDNADTSATTAAPAATTAAPNTTAAPDTTGAPNTTSAPATTHAPAPSGKPIVVGMMSQDSGARQNPNFADGVAAWVDRVNEEGGIDGHPVEFKRCDNESDADKAGECARSLADDPAVLVVSGMGGFDGAVGLPIYDKAGLGMITVTAFTPPEQQGANVVGLNGSLITSFPAQMQYFKDKGAEKISMIGLDAASVDAAAARYEKLAGEIGLKWLSTTRVAADVPDYLPTVTAALAGEPDAIIAQVLPAQLVGILNALETLGSKIPVMVVAGSVTADVLATPAALGRLHFESDVAPAKDGDADYAYMADRFKPLADTHLLGFALGRAFQQAIEGAGGADATRAKVVDFIQHGTFKDLPWLPPAITRSDAPAAYPAIANPSTFVATIDANGKKVYLSDRVTPTAI
jgi:ABC-type branched-subunit amino acid transport system substrate-binding protein